MPENEAKLAIIGGTGLNEFEQGGVENPGPTPFGPASGPIVLNTIGSKQVGFLARHGSPHTIPPDKINYRANIWALKNQGFKLLVGVNAVGGIHKDLPAGTIVIPDQLVDYSYGREHTYFDGKNYAGFDNNLNHIDFTYPYSENLRQSLVEAAGQCQIPVVTRAVYAAVQGPRLETAAEINKFERDGCDIIGMTGMPEAALAREMDLNYGSICLVVNPAAGRSDGLISMEEIHQVIAVGMVKIRQILLKVVDNVY